MTRKPKTWNRKRRFPAPRPNSPPRGSSLEMAQANQKQYNALANYSRITAPFAGVITARLADTGALIQGGTSASSGAGPVVRLAEVSKLATGFAGSGIRGLADSSR